MSACDRPAAEPLTLDDVLALQRPSGAFGSTIVRGRTPLDGVDENAFVTVQVLRVLAGAAPEAEDRALAFLARCELVPAAYGFWPRDAWPSWAPRFGADVDDTALVGGFLHRTGRVDRTRLLELAATLSSARVRDLDRLRPMWIAPGAFGTWIDGPPIVDCVVNANVAGFLAAAGWRGQFGYADAVATVLRGLEWAGTSLPRLGTLAPFYPHPSGLLSAAEAAVEDGAVELEEVPALLEERFGPATAVADDAPVCGSAYGVVRWYAPVVAMARRVMRAGGTRGG